MSRDTMNQTLPRTVAAYFEAANAHDSRLLPDTFTEDAVVQDEGHEYRGLAAIMAWNETATAKYALNLSVTSVRQEAEQMVVQAQASGNFDGSPTTITYFFTMADQKISHLRCE